MKILQKSLPQLPPRAVKNENRRSFLRGAIGLGLTMPWRASAAESGGDTPIANLDPRSQSALQMRQQSAAFECQPSAAQLNNGDEIILPGFVGCFTKGLPHEIGRASC